MNASDIALLNQSMQNLGESFRQNRLDDERTRQQQVENTLKEKMLGIDEKRWNATQQHYTNMENKDNSGKVDAWLNNEGGTVHYSGTPEGLQKVLEHAQQQGKPLKILDTPPTNKPQYGTFKTDTELGTFEFHMEKPEDVDTVMSKAKEIGGKRPSSQPGQSSTAKELETAAGYRDKAATEADPAKKQQYLDYANVLEKRAKAAAVQPEDYETVTKENYDTGEKRSRKVPIAQPPAALKPKSGPVTVTTKAERDKLPAGTQYVGPDGKTYIKQ